MKVLLVGAGGMLATDLVKTKPAGVELDARDLHRLDVTSADSIAKSVSEVRPDWILNASGYTAVDRAESERDLATAVNGIGPGLLGDAAKRAGARVARYASDFTRSHQPRFARYQSTVCFNPLSNVARGCQPSSFAMSRVSIA